MFFNSVWKIGLCFGIESTIVKKEICGKNKWENIMVSVPKIAKTVLESN